MSLLGKALVQYDWCPYKKRKLGPSHGQREDTVRTQEKMAIQQPRREASGKAILPSSQVSRLLRRNFLLLKPPG